MITEQQILEKLDNYKLGHYCQFIDLGHVYSYLIDSRLTIFKDGNDKWAIAAERLGYNPRAGGIMLDIVYFGNCLSNLESHNGQTINYYTVFPIDWACFTDTENGEIVSEHTASWNIRGVEVKISHNPEDYHNAGIEPNEYNAGQISFAEAGRLLITQYKDLLRATDNELYKSIPTELKKLLVIDEWHHRDFIEVAEVTMSDEQIKATYEFNKNLWGQEQHISFEDFAAMFNRPAKQNNQPSSYETWQLIAKVISTGDPRFYKPTLQPNSHWKNWPDSGSL